MESECWAAMAREPEIDFIDTQENLREYYQYIKKDGIERLGDAG